MLVLDDGQVRPQQSLARPRCRRVDQRAQPHVQPPPLAAQLHVEALARGPGRPGALPRFLVGAIACCRPVGATTAVNSAASDRTRELNLGKTAGNSKPSYTTASHDIHSDGVKLHEHA